MNKEFGEKKPKSKLDIVADFLRKWYAVVIALFAVAGGFWGIFYPVKTYLEERQKAVKYTINENMIKALEDLESDNISAKNSLIVLSYYDLNAIPILLNKYYVLDRDEDELRQEYIKTISLVYKRRNIGIVDRIIATTDKNYQLLLAYLDENHKNHWKHTLQPKYILNLVELTEDLDMEKGDKKKIKAFYSAIISDIDNNKEVIEIDGVALFRDRMQQFIDDKAVNNRVNIYKYFTGWYNFFK